MREQKHIWKMLLPKQRLRKWKRSLCPERNLLAIKQVRVRDLYGAKRVLALDRLFVIANRKNYHYHQFI